LAAFLNTITASNILRRALRNYAGEFISWLRTHINQPEQILNYRKEAPNAAKAHPSAEHFLPLIVAMGAGRPDVATCIQAFLPKAVEKTSHFLPLFPLL
jgi:aromatic ring-opening dioxygenase catalytic subunit (LigB family)